MSSIHRAGHSPVAAIGRSRIAALQSAVDEKVDTRDADVVARRRGDRYG